MSEDFSENKPKLPSHIAYSVQDSKNNKMHWNKVGAAWPIKDDGLTVKLHSMPLNGEIVLRNREALERMREQKNANKQKHNPSREHSPKHDL